MFFFLFYTTSRLATWRQTKLQVAEAGCDNESPTIYSLVSEFGIIPAVALSRGIPSLRRYPLLLPLLLDPSQKLVECRVNLLPLAMVASAGHLAVRLLS